MDASKGSLEPVRGSKLPMKVGKNMKGDEVRVFAQKDIQITISFFQSWKTTNFFTLMPNLCTLHLAQMSSLPLRNIEKISANSIQKYVFIEGFADLCQIYLLL